MEGMGVFGLSSDKLSDCISRSRAIDNYETTQSQSEAEQAWSAITISG